MPRKRNLSPRAPDAKQERKPRAQRPRKADAAAQAPQEGASALLQPAASGAGQILADPPFMQTTEPVAVRSPHDAVGEPDAPARINVDALDPITQQMGAQFWRTNPIFDWCRQPNGLRHRFTRYYFQQHVLLDIFSAKTLSVEKEVAQKSAAIVKENAARKQRGEAPIGYLPLVRGATVPFESFNAAKEGEVLPLQAQRNLAMVGA